MSDTHITTNCSTCRNSYYTSYSRKRSLRAAISADSEVFDAWPNSTVLTLDAKLREHIVSPTFFSTGATCTIISVFESPPVNQKQQSALQSNDTMWRQESSGQHANTRERERGSLLSESCSRYVSFEFLNGTWDDFPLSACMTSPSEDSDLLML